MKINEVEAELATLFEANTKFGMALVQQVQKKKQRADDISVLTEQAHQDGEYILTQLDREVNPEKMIRNTVGNLEEHADYFNYCTKWREKVDSWKNATPPIPVTWDMFKSHFNKART